MIRRMCIIQPTKRRFNTPEEAAEAVKATRIKNRPGVPKAFYYCNPKWTRQAGCGYWHLTTRTTGHHTWTPEKWSKRRG